MTENEEKKNVEDSKEEETEKTDEKHEKDENTYDTTETNNEKEIWVDKNGKRPISYLLPTYIGVGIVFLIIWILIIVLAVMPAWDSYEKNKDSGLEIHMGNPDVDSE